MSEDPVQRAKAIVGAVTYFDDPQKLVEISMGLRSAMKGIDIAEIPSEQRLQERGW
jgi:pyridoxal 5'-phosphate synthase pdxS subunit